MLFHLFASHVFWKFSSFFYLLCVCVLCIVYLNSLILLFYLVFVLRGITQGCNSNRKCLVLDKIIIFCKWLHLNYVLHMNVTCFKFLICACRLHSEMCICYVVYSIVYTVLYSLFCFALNIFFFFVYEYLYPIFLFFHFFLLLITNF